MEIVVFKIQGFYPDPGVLEVDLIGERISKRSILLGRNKVESESGFFQGSVPYSEAGSGFFSMI